MKRKNILYIFLGVFTALCFGSCDDYLNTMPDNRAEVDTAEKIGKLLVSAYSANSYVRVTEMLSDNVDDYGSENPYTDRFSDQLFNWEDVQEGNNESPERVWSSLYGAIACANQALEAMDDLGNTEDLLPWRGEALVCRAYAHFMLVNIFCLHYTENSTALGIPYMENPETELNPQYERGTVADVYAKIEKDLEEGLPLINDVVYSVPKYHFNKRAAYAFASRFYLYCGKWEKSSQYATSLLGSNPKSLLRDLKSISEMVQTEKAISLEYIKAENKCNLLLMTAYSQLGLIFGAYYTGSRYSHGSYLSATETVQAQGIWGSYNNSLYWARPFVYEGTNLDKTLMIKLPYIFEMKDPVAGTGYARTVYPAFTTDEALLNRAEAYVMNKEYDKAVEDINIWMNNTFRSVSAKTRNEIVSYYSGIEYHTTENPTVKKKFNAAYPIEPGDQENLLQCIIHCRRIETLHLGLRWFDVKRLGIEIHRRVMAPNGLPSHISSTLRVDDSRRALQVPQKVVDAGLTPNPR